MHVPVPAPAVAPAPVPAPVPASAPAPDARLRRGAGATRSPFAIGLLAAVLIGVLPARVISLALPFSLHLTFVMLPFATLFALSVAPRCWSTRCFPNSRCGSGC